MHRFSLNAKVAQSATVKILLEELHEAEILNCDDTFICRPCHSALGKLVKKKQEVKQLEAQFTSAGM